MSYSTYVHSIISYIILTCLYAENNFTSPLQLRLVGGNDNLEGRIEILYYGIWGFVCYRSFGFNDANVACRQLGFPGAIKVIQRSQLSSKSVVPLWLSFVQCFGNETGLEQCSHQGFGNPGYCNQYDYVGVQCIGK